jgi:hypothetical protein
MSANDLFNLCTYCVNTIYTNKSTNFRRLTHTFISTLIFVISSILSRWPIYAAQYYHLLPTKNAFTLTSIEFTETCLKPHSLEMVMESNSKYIIVIINVSRQIHIVTLYHYWLHWTPPPLHTYNSWYCPFWKHNSLYNI